MRPRRSIALALACAGLAVAAAPARAVWPQEGGDAGRSGYQPIGDGTAPVQPLWATAGNVVTAPVITAARFEDQRVVYGTTDGRVHVRRLGTGAAIGSETGIAVAGLATLAVDGTRLYALHTVTNTPGPLPTDPKVDDDVSLAVIDTDTGTLVSDSVVSGTAGLQPSAPAVVAGGALVFLARDSHRAVLFRRGLAGGKTTRGAGSGAAPAAAPSGVAPGAG